MAEESLANFFAVYHGCNGRILQRAVIRCATGRFSESLLKAAASWYPESPFHQTLKRNIFDPPFLTRNQIAPTATRVRKKLEAWLRLHYPPPQRPPIEIKTLWDIFNDHASSAGTSAGGASASRYSRKDIKGAIWFAMYGDHGEDSTWKAALQSYARWHTATNAWERELISFMTLTSPRPDCPSPRTLCMYSIAKRITAWLRKNSTFDQYQKTLDRPPPPFSPPW